MVNTIQQKTPNRALRLGTNVATSKPVSIGLARLSEHVDICGPTGCGKTRSIMLPLFEKLAPMPDVSVIAMTCKGDFCSMCFDSAVAQGLTRNLVRFSPGQVPLVGFNPLRRNGWPAERHAKVARTAVLAARGEHSLDETPQLARMLFLCLAVALEQGLTLVEAASLLRPGRSALRGAMLRAVRSEFLRESLEWFNDLKDVRQEEVGASTVGRLQNFVGDPLIRAILTEQSCCLDVGEVIKNHKKLCIDLSFYNPLVPDDARTMGRLLLNNVLAHKFATPAAERTPTVLLIDEVQEFATEDLAVALTLGRELKISIVMAHQFPTQLKLSAEGSHLFEAVQECCRTKIVFGGMHVSELEEIVKELMIDRFNPKLIKDERTTLELEPVESKREVVAHGITNGSAHSLGVATSSATNNTRTRGKSRQWGANRMHTDALSLVHSSGVNAVTGTDETVLPSGEIISASRGAEGRIEMDALSTMSADGYGQFQAEGEQETSSEGSMRGKQTSAGMSVNKARSEARSLIPFYEYIKRRVVSSRTFQTLEEFLVIALQVIKALPRAHFVIKTPEYQAIFVKADFVDLRWVSEAQRERASERIQRSLSSAGDKMPVAHSPYQLAAPEVEFSETPPPTFREED